jgi:hypothetical protein
MLVGEFFVWWYTRGWYQVVLSMQRRMTKALNMFSASSILRTLFAPWRRIVTDPGDDIGTKFRAFGDNLVSRCVGFTVRIFTLLIAGILLFFVGIINIFLIIIWPFLPLAIVVAIYKGITG